jgi:hypothetical protein
MRLLVVVLVVTGVVGVLVTVGAVAQESRSGGSNVPTIGPMDAREVAVEFTKEAGGDPLRVSRCRVKIIGEWVQIEQRGDSSIFVPQQSIKSLTVAN